MSEPNEIIVDEQRVKRLLQKLIIMEKNNIKTKQYNEVEMVKKIKKAIEEEIECY